MVTHPCHFIRTNTLHGLLAIAEFLVLTFLSVHHVAVLYLNRVPIVKFAARHSSYKIPKLTPQQIPMYLTPLVGALNTRGIRDFRLNSLYLGNRTRYVHGYYDH